MGTGGWVKAGMGPLVLGWLPGQWDCCPSDRDTGEGRFGGEGEPYGVLDGTAVSRGDLQMDIFTRES